MKKTKILYIITQSNWGGAQKYVFDLAVNFGADFDIAVACGGSGELIEKLKVKNIQVFELKNLVREINPVRDFLGLLEIYKLIKKEKPDIVHTNSSKAEILGNIAAWLTRTKKIIFTAHGFVFNEDLGYFKKKFYIFWEKVAGFFATRIICVSEFDCKKGIENKIAPAEKFVVIHNGLKNSAENISQINKVSGKIIIGTVANFYPNKGLEYFVRAAGILNKQFNNLEFQIVGEGSDRGLLESEIAKLNLINFRLLGFQKKPEDFLLGFDIFVLPSLKEGFPYAILEAMNSGLPIVATRVGGVPEAVENGKNGFLVEAKDPVDLAQKIGELIENKDKRFELGNAGAQKVRKYFSLEQMIEKTKKVYNA